MKGDVVKILGICTWKLRQRPMKKRSTKRFTILLHTFQSLRSEGFKAKGIARPMIKRKDGKIQSAGVSPFHSDSSKGHIIWS